ncbi:FAD-dependent oxidoreductase [Geodermatophilus sp. DSM 44513]|uniref:FAD-dependent oxidoreductase n=1 Tax=Geodermatophilus sp. DSM 44513 TaxID=1528104 RepID=UPI00127C9F41|nr:FAD-dependent oxidoreductase [Geodermatophilus sp. DSM 44513]WNV76829.1 FAD-dependent oxidoreductase [Geodermatophilus sp. DSM 44513]
MTHTAVVVGAGIAGLAAAISLARTGWQVTVLERSPELAEVGAGLAMTPNAVAAFRGLGFGDDDVAALGYPTRAGGIADRAGRPVLTLPDTPVVRRSVGLVGVHRRRLHAALHRRALACGVEVVTGTAVARVEPGEPEGAPAVVEERRADLVVGADGMRSPVRAALFPASRPVYSGYSSWRGIAPGAHGTAALQQYWGPHAEFGIVRVAEEETYWYGYVAMPERTVLADELGAARERFAGWAGPVQEVLAATPSGAVLRHDVQHLPGGLPRYTNGRVVMIGDAAHGTLPTMGQGAATALEDGLCVGLLVGAPVATGGRLAPALDGFDAARRPRCRALARASIASGRFGSHLGGGWRQTLRNSAMRLTPAGAITRGSRAVMGWTPPEPAAPVPGTPAR